MNESAIQRHLLELDGWQLNPSQTHIFRDYIFKDFHQTMDFVNAVATIAHAENHHPDMEIGYRHCLIKYTTHSSGGLSDKDFVCAKQVNNIPFDN